MYETNWSFQNMARLINCISIFEVKHLIVKKNVVKKNREQFCGVA